MMFKMLLAALTALATAAAPLSSGPGASFQTFAVGPGLINLSPGDHYATYQWGLKNDGEFEMIEIFKRFQFVDDFYQSKNGDSSIRIPNPVGPDSMEMRKTMAQKGVDINILPAWELYESAENKRDVIVAVIDTGIDVTHPDLADSMWVNSGEIPGDGIDNDNNGYVDDVYGWNFYGGNNILYNGKEDTHGTHAAGTIAASRDNGGIVGIGDNRHIKVMSLKALGGSEGSGSPEDVIAAIRYAEANGASICNLSFGSGEYSEELAQTMADSSMLFVVAAGNGDELGIGFNIDTSPVYPASFPSANIISVANMMFDGALDTSSNFGTRDVDIAAPGSYILSTAPENGYAFMSGTSMAAPMVTGVAAMLYSYRTDFTLTDVKNVLLASARKSDLLSGRVTCGGMLDAYAAFVY